MYLTRHVNWLRINLLITLGCNNASEFPICCFLIANYKNTTWGYWGTIMTMTIIMIIKTMTNAKNDKINDNDKQEIIPI